MPSKPNASPFTVKQITEMNQTLRKLQDAKDLCERAGRCGMPTDEYLTEIDAMIEFLNKLRQEFVQGKLPAKPEK